MTLDLAKLRAETLALINGTTPGPWVEGQEGNARVYGPDGMGAHSGLVASFCRRADTRLVTAAPTLAADTLRLLDEIERLRAALERIACQKRTDELVTAFDVEYADFEDGYDLAVDAARAALAEGGPDDR